MQISVRTSWRGTVPKSNNITPDANINNRKHTVKSIKSQPAVNLNNLVQIPTKNPSPKPLISKCFRIGYLNARPVCVER